MRPYDERLDLFLSRAATVFADQGYHSTTMRDLAAATGMSLARMYYYGRGKEELLGMMNWIYNGYDPGGEMDPEGLAGLIARIFLGGFAEARSPIHGG